MLFAPASFSSSNIMHACTQSATSTWRRETNSRTHAMCSRRDVPGTCSYAARPQLSSRLLARQRHRAVRVSAAASGCTIAGSSSDTPAALHHVVLSAAAAAACQGQLGSSRRSHLFTHALLCPALQSLYTMCWGSQRQPMSGTSSGLTGRKPSNSTPTSTKR